MIKTMKIKLSKWITELIDKIFLNKTIKSWTESWLKRSIFRFWYQTISLQWNNFCSDKFFSVVIHFFNVIDSEWDKWYVSVKISFCELFWFKWWIWCVMCWFDFCFIWLKMNKNQQISCSFNDLCHSNYKFHWTWIKSVIWTK